MPQSKPHDPSDGGDITVQFLTFVAFALAAICWMIGLSIRATAVTTIAFLLTVGFVVGLIACISGKRKSRS